MIALHAYDLCVYDVYTNPECNKDGRPRKESEAERRRAPAAPRAPRVNPPAPLLRQDQQQKSSAPSHQISDDPYAFHPSEYAGHVSGAGDEQEDAFDDALESSLEDVEDVSAIKDDSASEEEEEEEEKPAQKIKVKMARKQINSNTNTASVSGNKSSLLSGPDSSFAVFLSARGTNTSSNGATAATSKVPSSNTIQQKQTGDHTTTAAAAAATSPPVPAAAATPVNTKKKKKLRFVDQAELPIMIPKGVARNPAGTALIIELPQHVELAGASGVVGRIIGVGGSDGEADGGNGSASGNERDSGSGDEAKPKSGIVLDLMGIQYATEVVQLPSSLAVAHLTGGRLIVDSILTTAVRATAVPGQHGGFDPGTGNQSVYSMEFDSESPSEYEDDTFGGTHTSNASEKKAKGGVGGGGSAKKGRKNSAVRKAGGKVKKTRGTTATKKRATSSKTKGAANRI